MCSLVVTDDEVSTVTLLVLQIGTALGCKLSGRASLRDTDSAARALILGAGLLLAAWSNAGIGPAVTTHGKAICADIGCR